MLDIMKHILGSSYKKMRMKNPKYVLHSLYVLEIFQNHPKNVCYFRIYLVVLINKSTYKKLKQLEVNTSIYFRDYKTGQ